MWHVTVPLVSNVSIQRLDTSILEDEATQWSQNVGHQQWHTQDFFLEGGSSTNSVEDRGQRERGSGGGSHLVRGSGGSCNLVQEISFHMVTFSSFLAL